MSDMALESDGSVQLPEGDTAPAPSTESVEEYKKRNSGLQRALQEALAKNRALEAAQASFSQPKPETPAESTPPETQTGLETFLADLMEERIENWRDKAIEQYPQVAPLREYLTANSKAEVLALAKDLAEKLGGTTPPSEEATPVTETPTTPPALTATVTGGSPALPPSPTDDEELAELRMKAAKMPTNQNWSAYLQKKFEMAGAEYPS